MALSSTSIQKAVGVYADGIIGPKTKAAIKTFQKAHGLVPDGIVGPLTEAAMAEVLTFPVRPSPEEHAVFNPPIGKVLWPTQAQCPEFYGPPGKVKLQSIVTPYPMYYDGKALKTISVHTKIAAPVRRILERVKEHYGVEQIHTLKLDDFSGCYNPRRMRGGSAWSMHAYACALDFNAADNQLSWGKDRARFAQPVYNKWWEFWEEEGAVSLGRSANYDWMHVQFARIR